jgi:hypothetical protein
VNGAAPDLDVTASRTEGQFFLHVVNTNRTRAQACRLAIEGLAVASAKAYEMAADPQAEITSAEDDPMKVREVAVALDAAHSFPAASVTVVEFRI